MPLLFCVGRRAALEAVQRGMSPDEKLLAFLDDLYIVSKPERVGTLHSVAQRELWAHRRIRVHGGKTHVWNRAGQKPEACNRLQRVAEVHDRTARVWRGSEVPLAEQGIKVLGTPVGHDEYARSLLEKIQAKQQFLLNAIPTVPDVQSAWLLLLHCASARCNFQLRVVRPELVNSFAESHDQGAVETCDGLTRATATLPLSLGGLGLRSAARTRESAHWASWADTLSMVQARHPSVAELMVYHLEGESWSPSLRPASQAATELDGIQGFILP